MTLSYQHFSHRPLYGGLTLFLCTGTTKVDNCNQKGDKKDNTIRVVH